jgi:hypothetical protein
VYILYLDESGTTPQASNFVLAGLAVFEREIFWLSQELDNLQHQYFPQSTEPILFHAHALHVRDGDPVEPPWDQIDRTKRLEIKNRIFEILRNRRAILFACAIDKKLCEARHEDFYERAFEDLASRFDMFMSRVNRQAVSQGLEEQRGLIVLAESSYQKILVLVSRRLRQQGTRWGTLHNVSDVPLFAPAKDTRLLQYADFCSNAVFGRYQSKLTGDFDMIAAKFDQEGGVLHGLSHLTTDPLCSCIACFSRRGRQPPLSQP